MEPKKDEKMESRKRVASLVCRKYLFMDSVIGMKWDCFPDRQNVFYKTGKDGQVMQHDRSKELLEVIRSFELLNVGCFTVFLKKKNKPSHTKQQTKKLKQTMKPPPKTKTQKTTPHQTNKPPQNPSKLVILTLLQFHSPGAREGLGNVEDVPALC